jgi:hypothetical protein
LFAVLRSIIGFNIPALILKRPRANISKQTPPRGFAANHLKGKTMTEVKMTTTLYFSVPLGESPTEYIEELLSLDKLEMLARVTDFTDGEIELS